MYDLFAEQNQHLRLLEQDGLLDYWPHFLSPEQAQELYLKLLQDTDWQSEVYQVYGKSVEAPRRVAWYGDSDATYTYSGITHQPLAWTPTLLQIKKQLEQTCHYHFNSVLLNLYRDGQDSMGWHADKEPELGPNPVIASLTLGQARLFKLRHNKSKQVLDVTPESGALLLMHGTLQHYWQHSVPKSKKPMQPRINLTFRKIITS